jgi:hypothetical protein
MAASADASPRADASASVRRWQPPSAAQLASARSSGARLPDFFIVGHPKSGTTALYEMLRTHPQVFMPQPKEPFYLSRELHPDLDSSRHPDTLEQYLELFAQASPGQITGEASSSYLRSPHAAERIAQLQPAARIIAILREPASFLRSVHLELLQDHLETEKDFRRAIEREQLLAGEKPVLRYSEDRVHYAEQLRRYRALFAAEQVLVLVYDDFRADNAATVRRVLRFLGVDEHVEVPSIEGNPTVQVRSPRMYSLVRSVSLGEGPVGRALSPAIKALSSRRLRRTALRALRGRVLLGSPAPAEQELMLELRRRFKPHVQEVGEYLGRDLLALWGYESID